MAVFAALVRRLGGIVGVRGRCSRCRPSFVQATQWWALSAQLYPATFFALLALVLALRRPPLRWAVLAYALALCAFIKALLVLPALLLVRRDRRFAAALGVGDGRLLRRDQRRPVLPLHRGRAAAGPRAVAEVPRGGMGRGRRSAGPERSRSGRSLGLGLVVVVVANVLVLASSSRGPGRRVWLLAFAVVLGGLVLARRGPAGHGGRGDRRARPAVQLRGRGGAAAGGGLRPARPPHPPGVAGRPGGLRRARRPAAGAGLGRAGAPRVLRRLRRSVPTGRRSSTAWSRRRSSRRRSRRTTRSRGCCRTASRTSPSARRPALDVRGLRRPRPARATAAGRRGLMPAVSTWASREGMIWSSRPWRARGRPWWSPTRACRAVRSCAASAWRRRSPPSCRASPTAPLWASAR